MAAPEENSRQNRHWQPKWKQRQAPPGAWLKQQQRRGTLRESKVTLGSRTITLFEANGDYGTRLWPTAEAVAAWISESEEKLHGMQAIEIGCGNGLCTLALAAAGAHVLATDYDPAALKLTEVAVESAGLSDRVRTALFDICNPTPLSAVGEGFHILLAADVMYSEALALALARRCVEADNMGIRSVVADPGRPTQRIFLDALAAAADGSEEGSRQPLSARVVALNELEGMPFDGWARGQCNDTALSALHRLAADNITMLKVTGAGGARELPAGE